MTTLTEPLLATATTCTSTSADRITSTSSQQNDSSSAHPTMTSSMDVNEWPAEAAKRVEFLTPFEYDPYNNNNESTSSNSKCYLKYDDARNVILVVMSSNVASEGGTGSVAATDADDGDVLDIIDPNDVIGCRVEIELSTSSLTNATTTTRPHQDSNLPPPSREAACDRATNEPQSDVLVDTQGSAVLTLFVYPRKDLTKSESVFTSCRLFGGGSSSAYSSNFNKPNLQYPQSSFLDDGNNPSSSSTTTTTTTTKPRYGHRYEHHRKFVVAPAEDLTDLNVVVDAIRKIIHPHKFVSKEGPPLEERLLVLVNPCSGKKAAVQIYNDVVSPILDQAGIDHDFIVTTHARHAEELVREQRNDDGDDDGGGDSAVVKDLTEYTGIVTIGGDGIVHEVMQGIHSRSDRMEILNKIKLGMIGAGTSNGLSATLAHASDEQFSPTDSAFMIAKGLTSRMDLSHYETSSKSYTSFLTFSWAIIADIDIESELIHWLGFLRMDVWGVVRTLFLRKYRAKFWYLPPSAAAASASTTADKSKDGTIPAAVTLPRLNEPIPQDEDSGWVYCEDDFILFWASQVTHAGEKMFHSPPCRIDDGLFHIFIVRGNVSRLRLALILLTMEHGGHVDMNGVEFIECVAYRLEPITPGSFNDLDGEVIEPGAIQASVLPSAIRAYCKGSSRNSCPA